MITDLRHALRSLFRRKAFFVAALLSLGLGIGANTAVFSIVDTLVLKPLPVKEPSQLVIFTRKGNENSTDLFSSPELQTLRSNSSLSGLTAASGVVRMAVRNDAPGTLSDSAETELVSSNFFSLLGVSAEIGRIFLPSDESDGGQPVAVISYRYWMQKFGGDPMIVGRRLIINGTRADIVGVVRKEFISHSVGVAPEIWMPLWMQPRVKFMGELRAEPGGNPNLPWFNQGALFWLQLIGRKHEYVRLERATSELGLVFRNMVKSEASETSDTEYGNRLLSQQLRIYSGARGWSKLRDQLSNILLTMMALVLLVLLIACANVANLQLARAQSQQREIAVSMAMGAQRYFLFRQLIAEGLILAVLGEGIGLLVAFAVGQLLLSRQTHTGVAGLAVHLDLRVLLFTSVMSLCTVVLFSLTPAVDFARIDLLGSLRDSGSRAMTPGRKWSAVSRALIVMQIAGSLTLTLGAGLFVSTLQRLKSQDTGYSQPNILLVTVDPQVLGLDEIQRESFYRAALDQMRSVPGVRSASMALNGAFTDNFRLCTVSVNGYVPRKNENPNVLQNIVTDEYFKTMGLKVLEGRSFDASDRKDSQHVAIINQEMAKHYFGTESPIGRTFGIGGLSHVSDLTVIGVTVNARYLSLRVMPARTFYVPSTQAPDNLTEVAVNTAGSPIPLVGMIRQQLMRLDGNLPVYDVTSMAQRIEESVSKERQIAEIASAFSTLALTLACIGLYGLMSYIVVCRTREIGLRVAVGATRIGIVWLVLKQVLTVGLIGLTIGELCSLALGRFISSFLFGISSVDLFSTSISILVVLITLLLASIVPAVRASRIDPLKALQYE